MISPRQIIRERGLWPASGRLNAQCEAFKCPPGRTDCCCRRLLFTQPDFESQKPALQEFVESRGHLCDFYPKYHCELNFIEQYWGAAKYRYRLAPRSATVDEMERLMLSCLDEVPLIHIRRYVRCGSFFLITHALEGLLIARSDISMHTLKVSPARRQLMPTAATTATAPYHLIFLPK